MKYIKISIVILLVSFISIFAYKLTTNKLSLTKEQMKEMLSYTIDGNSTSSMPSKGSGYKVKSITCKSGSILSWDNDNWLLEVEKLESEDLCNIDFTTGTGSYTVTAVPNIAGSLDSTSKTTTDNGQVTFYTDLAIDSVSGCTNEISDGKVIVKNITCNINLKFPTLATLIKEKSITHEDGIYEENGYRYEGSDPNNYIQMQKTDGTTEMWRIIGLFPDGENGEEVIRVRRHYEQGRFPSGAFDLNGNLWQDSTLYTNLKNDYNTSNYSGTVKFKMYLGTSSSFESYTSSDLYNMERLLNSKGTASSYANGVTSYVGEVGLIYPSDYGYAAQASDCLRIVKPNSYGSNSTCYTKNWLYQGSSTLQWIISPEYYTKYSVITIYTDGNLTEYNDSYDYLTPGDNGAYSPVMALKSDVVVTGSGTQSDPYIMK